MTDEEKVAAFDLLAEALTVCDWEGKWDWLCLNPMGGIGKRATQAEAVTDLVEWAARIAPIQRAKRIKRGL